MTDIEPGNRTPGVEEALKDRPEFANIDPNVLRQAILESTVTLKLYEDFWRAEAYSKDDFIWTNRSGAVSKLRPTLDTYLDVMGEVPEKFIIDAQNAAREYVQNPSTDSSLYDTRLLNERKWSTLLTNPRFMSDPRAINVIETLSEVPPNAVEIIGYYSLCSDYGEPIPGFGTQHLPNFERIIDSERIWATVDRDKNQGRDQNKVTSGMFSGIRRVLHGMEDQNPEAKRIVAKLSLNEQQHGVR